MCTYKQCLASFQQKKKNEQTKHYKKMQTFYKHQFCGVIRVAFSRDKTRIYAFFGDVTIGIFDKNLSNMQILKGYSGWVNGTRFVSDSKIFVLHYCDNGMQIWDLNAGKELITFQKYTGITLSSHISPDESTIVTGLADGTIQLWDAMSGKELKKIKGISEHVNDIQFSPDGQLIVLSLSNSIIVICNVKLGEKIKELRGHSSSVIKAQFSSDGKYIASCSVDKTVRIWDTASGKELKKFKGHSNSVCDVKYLTDDKTVISCSYDRTIRIWDVNTGKEMDKLLCHVALMEQFNSGSNKKKSKFPSSFSKKIIQFLEIEPISFYSNFYHSQITHLVIFFSSVTSKNKFNISSFSKSLKGKEREQNRTDIFITSY
ncbi:WD-40 repeat-containing protein [Reticulomyxa filosa]|uniref:WD-40 repeat-containing protein n=1 Tax=Reticulomyxa filosa TaxID=46433 RepID=X6M7T9_RETFI|nr:WD-40 repeat-containing protein [Reticulomyxa filosa]|eukprot:ETO09974.1 WD-40 repeat-containing protein [Reticulomyxa filosa]